MNAYIYRADIYCEDCAQSIIDHLPPFGSIEDSEAYPQGPFSEGGGEADCPQHCGECGVFLENPLTGDGYSHVAGRLDCYNHRKSKLVFLEWIAFYKGENDELDEAITRFNLASGESGNA